MNIKLLSLFLSLALSACNVPPTPNEPKPTVMTEVWTIGSHYKDCVGVAPMKCLMVTKPNGSPEFFYSAIEGFDYQEGFEYQIQVQGTAVTNPPADGSSISYKLVKLISQKKSN